MSPVILHTTSDDGMRLRLGRWGETGPDLLLVHGLAEHLGRYEEVAQALVTAGWRVTMVELRGHGESGGIRGHTPRAHAYIEDLQAAAATLGGPFVTVAHSMGGLVSMAAMLEPVHPRCLALAVSNPFLGEAFQPPAWKLRLAQGLSRVAPIVPINTELDTALICRDPEVVKRYEADPMVFGTVTPRWFTSIRELQEQVQDRADTASVPLRLMVSTADGICDRLKAMAAATMWAAPTTQVVYEGLYHELFNEPERELVLSELITWLAPFKEQIHAGT